MSTKVPKAWETTWAQEAVEDELQRSAAKFQHNEGERARIDRVLKNAANPDGCSAEIIPAPARGALQAFREGYWYEKDGKGEWRHLPYRSGCPGQTRDIFDTMTDQAARRGGEAPFTAAQVGAARDYRHLHERVEAAGMKCSKAFDVQTGAGQGRVDFIDAYMRDTERLALFRAAIGDGVAKDTRRRVAATEGGVRIGDVELRRIGRKLITVRRLIDMVCIAEQSLSDVLETHGWRATGKNRMSLRAALCAALGRMQGI